MSEANPLKKQNWLLWYIYKYIEQTLLIFGNTPTKLLSKAGNLLLVLPALGNQRWETTHLLSPPKICLTYSLWQPLFYFFPLLQSLFPCLSSLNLSSSCCSFASPVLCSAVLITMPFSCQETKYDDDMRRGREHLQTEGNEHHTVVDDWVWKVGGWNWEVVWANFPNFSSARPWCAGKEQATSESKASVKRQWPWKSPWWEETSCRPPLPTVEVSSTVFQRFPGNFVIDSVSENVIPYFFSTEVHALAFLCCAIPIPIRST